MPDLTEEAKKLRVESLLKLGDARIHDADRRREYQWKVNFALWSALGIMAGLQFRGELKLSLHTCVGWLIVALMVVIGIVYTFSWSQGGYCRNRRDVSQAHWYWNQVEDDLGIEGSPRRVRSEKLQSSPESPWKDWSFVSELTITWIMILLVLISLFSKLTTVSGLF